MDKSGLIAVAQINVALGILYINLKDLRFRETYEKILQLLDTYRFRDLCKDESGEMLLMLLKNDSEFSTHWHNIRAWILELSGTYQEQMLDVVLALRQGESTLIKKEKKDSLLKKHRMFREDKDKSWVWKGTIVPSLVILWAVAFSFESLEWLFVVSCVGQIVLIYFYRAGRRIAKRVPTNFEKSLESIMKSYRKCTAHQQFKEQSTSESLPGSAPSQ